MVKEQRVVIKLRKNVDGGMEWTGLDDALDKKEEARAKRMKGGLKVCKPPCGLLYRC